MTAITPGKYHINTILGNSPFIGRPLKEDRSLLPKAVVTLPTQEASSCPVCPYLYHLYRLYVYLFMSLLIVDYPAERGSQHVHAQDR
jgi:hypothetical protein